MDYEFKYAIQRMLERFLEEQLSVVNTAEGLKIIGIPFVCQNIIHSKFLVTYIFGVIHGRLTPTPSPSIPLVTFCY